MTNALATRIDRATAMLAEARTLNEFKKVRDLAEAARVYAKAAHLGRDAEYKAAEIALLAAHKAGTILAQLQRGKPKPKGGREKESAYWKAVNSSGTSRRTAERWQAVAKKDESALEKYFTVARKNSQDISTAGFLRSVKPIRPPRNSPYTRHISIPLTQHEYEGVRKWAKNSLYGNSHLKPEQRFLREALNEFFAVTGFNIEWATIFEEKSGIAERLLKWLAQEPISKSPLFKQVMEQYGIPESSIEEARAEKARQRESMEEDTVVRQTEIGPVQD